MFLKNLSHPSFEKTQMTDFMCIGSSHDNHIVINQKGVSQRHARIEKKKDRYMIRDLKTATGTYVNDVRILESYLSIGDLIRIGETEFVFEDVEQENFSEFLKSNNYDWNFQLQRIPRMALSDLPMLILGASGCGKEVLSQIVHKLSHRRSGPVVSVNCSALSENLAESELFGHVKGSFTGASQDRKGAFESAKGGTLILDEVGDLPLNLQPKLLRALENKEIKPVGSDRIIKTNVRIIACTHQDLKKKVGKEEFRLDLFYRLNVIQIEIPALCKRMEDFEKILFNFARENQIKFSFDAIQKLKEHSWPGNVRELKNLVSKAKAIYDSEIIDAEKVASLIDPAITPTLPPIKLDQMTGKLNVIREIEKKLIVDRLIANGGNQRKTAEDLGIPKSTLHDRIKNYKINVTELIKRRWEAQLMASEAVF